ncbi:hypothetical protein GCM10012275_62850 [Longimycelium tulufanense]|uniref:VOC domain-containing protein n=1 Tax=Longimycelium tulufanense TaxID=907463 RepID=A0A8J3CIU7_9PSEU|nr:VOC family protein [Longimycelium tulufanense]GGM83668.1 hypothetical protein GCM10012275_62850 [Longimycelium tulufanense]
MSLATAAMYVFVYVTDLERSRHFYGRVLGLPVVEQDERSTKYDAGGVMLALNLARDFDVAQGARPDPSLLTFDVDDIDHAAATLGKRGAVLGETERYEIGATVTCLDPDGHSVCLYQPSTDALGWESGPRYRELAARSGGLGHGPTLGPDTPLGPLVYLFHFIDDIDSGMDFYENKLGLRAVERDPEQGVVKYDCGTVLLTTHLWPGEDSTAVRQPRTLSTVFRVRDVSDTVRQLGERGIDFSDGIVTREIGKTARFVDPCGHVYYLYEPSETALTWPSAKKADDLSAVIG